MKTLLVSEDCFLATAIRAWIDISWTGDNVPFLLGTHNCRKLLILVDDRILRRDYLRIKHCYPENVFLVRLRLSAGNGHRHHLPAGDDFLHELEGSSNLISFVDRLGQFSKDIYRKQVPLYMRLYTTKMEKRVLFFLSHGTSITEIALALHLSEKGILNHCYMVARRFGFSNLTFFCTFMFPRAFQPALSAVYQQAGEGRSAGGLKLFAVPDRAADL